MRTILRDNYTPEIGDYHECLVVDEPEKKIWLFDCDGVYSDISPVTVVSELGDSEKYAASQKLVTGLNSDLWTEVGVINNKIAALATDFSYKGSVEDYYHLPDDAAVGDVYTTLDTGIMYVWDGNQWVALNEVPENEVVSVYTDTAIVSGTPLTLYSDEECTNAVTIGSIVRNIEAGKSYQVIRIGDAVDEAYLIYPVISARDDGSLENAKFGIHLYDGRSLYYAYSDLASATVLSVSGKLIPSDILDEPGSSYTAVMSQAGVTNLVNRNAGAPTSTTEGTVGSLIEDTTNGKLYICTNVDETDPSNPVYTWDLVGKDTFKLVTPADYGTTGKLEYWNLPKGLYQAYNPNSDHIDVQAYKYSATGEGKGTHIVNNGAYIIVGRNDRNGLITVLELGNGGTFDFYNIASNGYKSTPSGVSRSNVIRGDYVKDDLTSTDTMTPLSANQGKVLNEKIEGRVKTNAGAPTSSTTGTVGQLLEDTTNGKLYQCTSASGGVYTWEPVGEDGKSTLFYFNSNDNLTVSTPVTLYKDKTLSQTVTKAELMEAAKNGETVLVCVYVDDQVSPIAYYNWRYYPLIYNEDDSMAEILGSIHFVVWDYTGAVELTWDNTTTPVVTSRFNIPTVVQNPGTSTTNVMSQNATTSMVFADPSTRNKVRIGNNADFDYNMVAIGNVSTLWQYTKPYSSVFIGDGAGVINGYGAQGQVAIGFGAKTSQGVGCVSIGHSTAAETDGAVALGYNAKARYQYSVAFSGATAGAKGEMAVGAGSTHGYNNTAYRLITGVHDPVSANDAATKGYVDTAVAGAGAATINSTDWSNLWQ